MCVCWLFTLALPSSNMESSFAYAELCRMQNKSVLSSYHCITCSAATLHYSFSLCLPWLSSTPKLHNTPFLVCPWTPVEGLIGHRPKMILLHECLRESECLHKRDKWAGLLVDSCALSQLKFWQTSLSDMSKRAEIEEVGVVRVRWRKDGGDRRTAKSWQGQRRTQKAWKSVKRRRVRIEMDGLGAWPGLTVEPADVTQPRQGEWLMIYRSTPWLAASCSHTTKPAPHSSLLTRPIIFIPVEVLHETW